MEILIHSFALNFLIQAQTSLETFAGCSEETIPIVLSTTHFNLLTRLELLSKVELFKVAINGGGVSPFSDDNYPSLITDIDRYCDIFYITGN